MSVLTNKVKLNTGNLVKVTHFATYELVDVEVVVVAEVMFFEELVVD